MDWFFQISHPFVTLTQAGDQPKHPPAPHDEEYVEPHILVVPVPSNLPRHSVVRLVGLMFYKLIFI